MSCVTAELREIVEAVEIRSATSFAISGEPYEIRAGDNGKADLPSRLAGALYQRMYCRPQRQQPKVPPDHRAARVFVDALSQANCGNGTWDPGWIIEAVEADGALAVRRRRDELTIWARPEQFRVANGNVRAGAMGRLLLGKELREMLPGYYMALGEADQADDEANPANAVVRFYWHLTATAAALWIQALTRGFNTAGIPFRAKVPSDPGAYVRADAGVLYVAHRDMPAAMALMPELHEAVSPYLRQVTPMFTKPLAHGVAVAEDPGDGRSFGQHRCQLVAEGLVSAFANGRSGLEEVVAAVIGRFGEERLSVVRPWLNPDSRDNYNWPRAA